MDRMRNRQQWLESDKHKRGKEQTPGLHWIASANINTRLFNQPNIMVVNGTFYPYKMASDVSVWGMKI